MSSGWTPAAARAETEIAGLPWVQEPEAEGDFEPFGALETALRPLFVREVGPRFLAGDAANAESWKAGRAQTELTMGGQRYCQKTFKYPADALSILRRKFAAVAGDPGLRSFLDETGCLVYLESMGA